MSPLQSTLLIVFAIVAYLVVTDKSIEQYLTLMVKMISVNVERYWWMAKLHPKNPITNYFMNRRCEKLADQIINEFIENEQIAKDEVEYQET